MSLSNGRNGSPDIVKGTPLSRALTYSLILLMGMFGATVCILVWATINMAISDVQDNYMEGLRQGVETEIATFLNDRLAIMNDLAEFPIVIQGVMQPEIVRDNLADFLDSASLLGTRCQLAVLDYRGSIIYMTQAAPEFAYDESDWIASLIEEGLKSHTGISQTTSGSFWRLAVPVDYNDMAEGVLVAEIPLGVIDKTNMISDHMTRCQVEFRLDGDVIASFGPTIDSIPEISRIEDIGLDLHFRVDRSSVAHDLVILLVRLVVILIVLTVVFLIAGVALSKKVLVEPLDQLRDWTSSLGESMEMAVVGSHRIREIATLASNFEKMVDRLRRRDTALRKAHDELELRVEERTLELELETKRLELVLRGMGDGVIVTDMPLHVVLINPVAGKMIGSGRVQDCLGQILPSLFETNRGDGQTADDDFIEKLSGDSGEFVWSFDRQEVRFLKIIYSIYNDESGNAAGYVLIIHDITKEHQVSQMKTDFVSSVSHELRTPLTSIRGFTSTILRDPEMPAETRLRFLGIVDDESRRLTNLIDDLLEISRIESGKIRFDMTAVDIRELAVRSFDSMGPTLQENDLQADVECADDTNLVWCDAQKTQTMITNLLGNAVKFTPAGGRISVTTENRGKRVAIAISDTGIGIPEDELTRIFDRFYRGARPGLEVSGTGLGLSIVKEFVALQNGSIDVESEVGIGTTFTILLPCSA